MENLINKISREIEKAINSRNRLAQLAQECKQLYETVNDNPTLFDQNDVTFFYNLYLLRKNRVWFNELDIKGYNYALLKIKLYKILNAKFLNNLSTQQRKILDFYSSIFDIDYSNKEPLRPDDRMLKINSLKNELYKLEKGDRSDAIKVESSTISYQCTILDSEICDLMDAMDQTTEELIKKQIQAECNNKIIKLNELSELLKVEKQKDTQKLISTLQYFIQYASIVIIENEENIDMRNELDNLFFKTDCFELWQKSLVMFSKMSSGIDVLKKNLYEAICRNTDYSFQLTHLKRTKNIKTSDFYGGFDLTNSEERMRVEKAVEYLFHALTKLEYIDNTLDNFYLFSCRLTGATPFGNQIDFTKLSWKGTSDIGKSDLYVLIRLAFNSNSRNEYKSNKSIKVGNNTYGMYTKCKRFFEFADGSTYPSKIDNKLERYCSEDIKIICNQFIENLK